MLEISSDNIFTINSHLKYLKFVLKQHLFFLCLVKECGEELNATVTSQQHAVTSSSDMGRCSYVITSSPGSGVEVTISTGTLGGGVACSSVKVAFDPSKFIITVTLWY